MKFDWNSTDTMEKRRDYVPIPDYPSLQYHIFLTCPPTAAHVLNFSHNPYLSLLDQ